MSITLDEIWKTPEVEILKFLKKYNLPVYPDINTNRTQIAYKYKRAKMLDQRDVNRLISLHLLDPIFESMVERLTLYMNNKFITLKEPIKFDNGKDVVAQIRKANINISKQHPGYQFEDITAMYFLEIIQSILNLLTANMHLRTIRSLTNNSILRDTILNEVEKVFGTLIRNKLDTILTPARLEQYYTFLTMAIVFTIADTTIFVSRSQIVNYDEIYTGIQLIPELFDQLNLINPIFFKVTPGYKQLEKVNLQELYVLNLEMLFTGINPKIVQPLISYLRSRYQEYGKDELSSMNVFNFESFIKLWLENQSKILKNVSTQEQLITVLQQDDFRMKFDQYLFEEIDYTTNMNSDVLSIIKQY